MAREQNDRNPVNFFLTMMTMPEWGGMNVEKACGAEQEKVKSAARIGEGGPRFSVRKVTFSLW